MLNKFAAALLCTVLATPAMAQSVKKLVADYESAVRTAEQERSERLRIKISEALSGQRETR